jgi:excinuclease UvrABC nuclease subunit
LYKDPKTELYGNVSKIFAKIPKHFEKWAFDRTDFDPSLCKFEGLYFFLTSEGDLLYIGRAIDLAERISSHLKYETNSSLFMDYVHIIFVVKGAYYHEMDFIQKLKPIFNTTGTCRAYNLIRSHLIPKYPQHRDEIVRYLILRSRIIQESNVTKLEKFRTDADVKQALDMTSIVIGDWEEMPVE